ncbi:MAG: amidohydrolase family protein [Saprospiraceae bacterium]|nr:amidohydrolase family protein [Saprospiraceae bacterium]
MILDTHQHFWQFDPARDTWMTGEIRRDFLLENAEFVLKENKVSGCIAVQAAETEAETLFLLNLAEKSPVIKGVVGWADLKANDLSERLDFFSQFKKLKGFRQILQNKPPQYLLEKTFLDGVKMIGKRGFTYDILVFPKQLSSVKKMLQGLDNQPFVMDHLAKPYIKKKLIRQWAKDMRTLTSFEHLHIKLSGMVTEADHQNWKERDFHPYLDVVFEAFGVDRVFYGSDYPVCLLAADYGQQLTILTNYLKEKAHLSAPEIAQILGENGAKFYGV